jgi:diaminohydroxyphosphoribosylaminopyrimidine deaminase/5-amino-6-(5-phosphoribosylamino)uracil reductase
VDVGLLEAEAREMNAPFITLMTRRRPWVILKWAQSIDGKIATRTGDSKWISDETMRAHAHRARGRVDAILVGVETALRDDPMLTCRVGRPRRVAARIVLDAHLRLPPESRLVQTARQVPTWVFYSPSGRRSDRPVPPTPSRGQLRRRRMILEKAGCEVIPVAASVQGVSLRMMLRVLAARSLTNLLVEGGGRVLGSFFDERLFDEVHAYIAPSLIGGASAPSALAGLGAARLRDANRSEARTVLRLLGGGWLFTLRHSIT